MIIAFAWTTKALLSGRKTCTRRDWAYSHFLAWCKAWDEGRVIHQAWDKVPCYGGQHLGEIRLTARPYLEWLRDMPESDLEAEGGLWVNKEEFIELFGGDKKVAVVRFEWLGEKRQEANTCLMLPSA